MNLTRISKILSVFALSFILLSPGCAGPNGSFVSSNTVNNLDKATKSSVLDQVKQFLTQANCVAAYQLIQPIYNSLSTDNDIRLAMGQVFACYAKVNLFKLIGDLTTYSGNLAAGGLWTFFATEYASVANPDDKLPQAAESGTDAYMSVLNPGTLLLAKDTINATTQNPGSILQADRTLDANTNLTFISMSLMGSLLSRYGVANRLPWTTAASMSGDGCVFTSALLNFFDGLEIITSSSSLFSNAFGSISSIFGSGVGVTTGLNAACQLGCSTICGISCTTCPDSMRYRNSCTGGATDVNSCAGAGLVKYLVNLTW